MLPLSNKISMPLNEIVNTFIFLLLEPILVLLNPSVMSQRANKPIHGQRLYLGFSRRL